MQRPAACGGTVHRRGGTRPGGARRGTTWDVHFEHRYDIEPNGSGSKVSYTETIQRVNYVPYWLKPWARPIFKPLVNRADRKQLENLARLAEERSRDV